MANKNTKRQILRNYFQLSGPSQFTATMPLNTEINYGLESVVVEFSDAPTKTVNIILNFLFDAPAEDFRQKNKIELAGDLMLSDIPLNVGSVINMDVVFDTESNFLSFAQNFYADNKFEIFYK